MKQYFCFLFLLAFIGAAIGKQKLSKDDNDEDIKDLMVTEDEKKGLEMLKSQLANSITEPFMKSDFYLIRFLRVSQQSVPKAKEMVLNSIRWRQRNNMSTILFEDFSDLEADYPMTFYAGKDRYGRPYATVEFGEWDIRAAALHGNIPRLNKYLTFTLELLGRGIQELVEAKMMLNLMDRPVTKAVVLVDAEGMNAVQHLCPKCVVVLMTWIQNMEVHYPRYLKDIVVINAPPVAAVALDLLKPAMSMDTLQRLKIFGSNRKTWVEYLDKMIDPKERTQRYGGTRVGIADPTKMFE